MNANEKMVETLRLFDRPRVLLHACCAPCASACLERLSPLARTDVLFFNPNILSEPEYDKRAGELVRLLDEAPFGKDVHLYTEDYDASVFYDAVRGLEHEPERGARCHVCYRMRLQKTAEEAKRLGYDCFATTLTLSPLKDAEVLNRIGIEVEKAVGVRYLETDFKKADGYKRSLELSRTYGLYRQDFCGCAFSVRTETPFLVTESGKDSV